MFQKAKNMFHKMFLKAKKLDQGANAEKASFIKDFLSYLR